MTLNEFIASAATVDQKLSLTGELNRYFRTYAGRLHSCAERFGLFSAPLGDVLEIGPFYGYLPFILRPRSSSYTMVEGDDPFNYFQPRERMGVLRKGARALAEAGSAFVPRQKTHVYLRAAK